MAHVELVEQTFRDGQQSLWGCGCAGGMVEAVADDLDQAGFRAVEITGRIYDCLYNMDQMRRLCRTIHEAGGKALGAIMYGISPVHTDEWWSARVAEMVSWPEVSGIYVEDAPGILTAERAETFIPALLKAAGDTPIEWHFHNNTGGSAPSTT